MSKKFLSVLSLLALMLGMIPTIAIEAAESAEEPVAAVSKLYIGSVDALKTPSGEGWSYDVDSGVLTLNNCTLTENTVVYDAYSERNDAMIYFEGSLIIELIGTNSMERKISEIPAEATRYYAICANAYRDVVDGEECDTPSELSFRGDGNLTAGISLDQKTADSDYFRYSVGICCAADGGVDLSGLYGGGWMDIYGGIPDTEAPWAAQAFNNAPTFGDNSVVTAYRDLECKIENENGYNWNNNDAWRMKVETPAAHLNGKGLLTLLDSGNASGEGWTWANNVLTLSSATKVKAVEFRGSVDSAKLALSGDVSLDSRGMGYDSEWNYISAIKANCDLEINTGSYTLTLNNDEYGSAIRAKDADLLFSGGAVVMQALYGESIYSEGSNVTVKNAIVVALSEIILCDYYKDHYDENGDWYSELVEGGDLLIEDSVLELYGGATSNNGNFTVIDSTIYATSDSYQDGLSCNYADMRFENSDITIIIPSTAIEAFKGTVTFDNCTLNLQSTNEDEPVISAAYYKSDFKDDEDATDRDRWEPDLNAIVFLDMSVAATVGYTEEAVYWGDGIVGETVLKDSSGNLLYVLQGTAASDCEHTASEKEFAYKTGNACYGGAEITITYCGTCGGVYSRTVEEYEGEGHTEASRDNGDGHEIYCSVCNEWIRWEYHNIVDGACDGCGHVCEECAYYSYDYYEHKLVCTCGEEFSAWESHEYDLDTNECVCGAWTEVIAVFDYNGGYEEYNGVRYTSWQYAPAYVGDVLDSDYFTDMESWSILVYEGYTLVGFTTIKNDASTLVTGEHTLTENVTFYALWTSDGSACDHIGTELAYEENAGTVTHKVICKECNTVLVEAESCAGEDACTACGRIFCKHTGSKTYTPNMNYGGTDERYTHAVYCNDCRSVIDAEEECSGGTAYCLQRALCQYCGREYGDLAPEHSLSSPYQEIITPDENGIWEHVYIFDVPNTGRVTVTAPYDCYAYIYCEYYNDDGECVHSDDCYLESDASTATLEVRPGGRLWIWMSTVNNGSGMWTFTYTRSVGCQHENTAFASNGDGTHNQICRNETCGEVWESALECFDTDDNGCCDYCLDKICSENAPHELTLPYESGYIISHGSYQWDHYYSWTAPADGVLLIQMPESLYYTIYVNGEELSDTDVLDIKSGDTVLLRVWSYRFGFEGSWSAVFEEACGAELVSKDGKLYYYENGRKVPYKGLIEIDGYFYYVADNAQAICGQKHYVLNTNSLTWADGTPVKSAWYEFDENGKMIVKNGLSDGYYYENGRTVAYKGLVEIDGSFYYIAEGGKAVADKIHYVNSTNGLTWADGTPIEKVWCEFDENGRMHVLNGLHNGFYYENGKKIFYKGLIEVDGYFYYVADNAQIIRGKKHYVLNTNGLNGADGTPVKSAWYEFDENGKMVVE